MDVLFGIMMTIVWHHSLVNRCVFVWVQTKAKVHSSNKTMAEPSRSCHQQTNFCCPQHGKIGVSLQIGFSALLWQKFHCVHQNDIPNTYVAEEDKHTHSTAVVQEILIVFFVIEFE